MLENRKETLAELKNEYQIEGSLSVMCNTQKLQEMKVIDLFRVARTAGHFGLFCGCGIARAMEIFYLGESLSQCWAFFVRLIGEFPKVFKPLDQHILGYDSACLLKKYCDNQFKKFSNSRLARIISEIRKVHDRLHLQNHSDGCKTSELNPDKYEELNAVNTQVAEQFFAFLLKFVVTFRNTSAIRAPVWISLIQHQWNLKKEAKINNSLPTKKQMKQKRNVNLTNGFICSRRPVSEKSKARLVALHGKLRRRLLEQWCGQEHCQRSTLKRKREKTT